MKKELEPRRAWRKTLQAVTNDSVIRLAPIETQQLGQGQHIAGTRDPARFIEIDDHGLVAVNALLREGNLGDAQRSFKQQTGSSANLGPFLQELAKRDLIQEVDGQEAPKPNSKRHRFLERIPPTRIEWIHHRITNIFLAALILAWIGFVIREPTLVPGFHDLVITTHPVTSFLAAFAGLMGMAYIHELGHYFVARSYGIRPEISINQRFGILVLQTDVTAAWLLPRPQRIHIFLAGMTINGAFLFVATALQINPVTGAMLSDTAIEWLAFLAIVNFVPIIFQFLIFARTDLYYVMAALMRERNLHEQSTAYWQQRFYRRIRHALRFETERCTCGTLVIERDAFCPSCGTKPAIMPTGPEKYSYNGRRRYALFGVFLVLGHLWALLIMIRIMPRFIRITTEIGHASFLDVINGSDTMAWIELAGFVAIQLFQIAVLARLIGVRAWKFIKSPISLGVQIMRAARNTTPPRQP